MLFGRHLGLLPQHAETLARLESPEAIQDYVSDIPMNFEPDGDTCMPVAETLRTYRAHCIEGAMVAAAALWMGGAPPLLMDMQATEDDDHVIALFRWRGCWGAISKTNHVWVRWRDPVYRTLRELAMSYFHEYVNTENIKTLRNYSASFDLSRHDPRIWVAGRDSCWDLAGALDQSRHYPLLTPAQSRRLKARDAIEKKADKIVQYAAR